MTTLDAVRRQRAEILEIAKKHGATNVRIFGSVARGEDRSTSDIDLLVDTTESTSAWFPVGLIRDLESLLRRRVDVITERGLSPFLRDQILAEALPV